MPRQWETFVTFEIWMVSCKQKSVSQFEIVSRSIGGAAQLRERMYVLVIPRCRVAMYSVHSAGSSVPAEPPQMR